MEPTQWFIASERRSVTSDELVAFLATIPKPVHCLATARPNTATVDVECGRAPDSLAAFIQMSADFLLKRIQDTWANLDVASADVLFEGFQETSVVPYATFSLWLKSYHVDFVAIKYVFDPPPEDAVRQGARIKVIVVPRVRSP